MPRPFVALVVALVAATAAACERPDADLASPVVRATTSVARVDAAATPTSSPGSGRSTSRSDVATTIDATATTATTATDGATTSTTPATTPATTTTTTTTTVASTAAAAGGPGESLFPERRIVALYGNDVTGLLGVLGEQPPEAAAERLADVVSAWSASDRPIQGAFELIATIATAAPGPDGLYRVRSRAEHVQRYLDVADEHGLLLILDIQPGRSDFLTEVQHYEAFLRHPDVHVALDPEWHLADDELPGRGHVGQVDAADVNAVAEYLAGIVAAEGLPDKLLVVHQFQPRMVANRDRLVEPDGITLTIHMDGFGTQEQKLGTYAAVRADEPWNNGFKLFYDEDVDLFEPAEILALDPVPDLITYQ